MNWTFRTHAVNKSMTALIPAGRAQEGCHGLLAADVLALAASSCRPVWAGLLPRLLAPPPVPAPVVCWNIIKEAHWQIFKQCLPSLR